MTPEDALAQIRRSFDDGRMAHGYIIEGSPRGAAGELARKILELLMCVGNDRPCGECTGCRAVRKDAHPDVFQIEPQMKSRRISIEDIRATQGSLSQTAFSGGWKACVIRDADRLTQEAANCFLKTLEEPAGQTVFLLLTDNPQQLLPTVRSRCQRLAVPSQGTSLSAEQQMRILDLLVQGSDASVFASLSRAGGLELIMKESKKEAEKRIDDDDQLAARELDDKTLAAMAESSYRESRAEMLRFVLSWYRDLLHVVSGVDAHIFHGRYLKVLKEKAQRTTLAQALQNIRAIEEIGRRLEGNLPEGTVMAEAFMTLS